MMLNLVDDYRHIHNVEFESDLDMHQDKGIFELPKNIDRFLAALSKLYEQDGNRELQELIVNSQVRVHEEWSRDNLDGGTYGHALYLALPEGLYLRSVKSKRDIQKQIRIDLNQIHHFQREFIEEVFLEMEVKDNHDWRKKSGLLMGEKRVVPIEVATRIWGESAGFRAFFSYRTESKKDAAALKRELSVFGLSCFVAHEDIQATQDWHDEIENALSSMDGFVALMTEKFHDSEWTDQEVGFAVARGVPRVAVCLGTKPYGFLARFQGLTSSWSSAAEGIVKILIKNDRMFGAYIESLLKCPHFDGGNRRAGALVWIEKLRAEQVDELISAYNQNAELQGSFALNGKSPHRYGPGLVFHLNRLGSRQFRFSASGMIEGVPSQK